MTHQPIVELDVAGTWTDVSSYVRWEQGITVTHGQQSEDQQATPSTLALRLNNTGGRFTPGHPSSPYYGQIGRNTPIRVGVPYPHTGYLWVADDAETGSAWASCPDSAGVSVTGDIDIRVELLATDWSRSGELASKYTDTGDQRSWYLQLYEGRPLLVWSEDGFATKGWTASSAVPSTPGVQAVRATLDVDNGSGGWTVTVYTAPSIAGPWTQLDRLVTTTSTTSIYDSTATVHVGNRTGGFTAPLAGYFHQFQLYDGVDGTLVADPDFTAQTRNAASFVDDVGNTWTVGSDAFLETFARRFVGEVASWTPSRDISGKAPTIAVEAADLARRYTQGTALARSSMFREYTNPARQSIVAYWPMEDASEATQIAAGLDGVASMAISGSPMLAGNSDDTASDPLPIMGSGRFYGSVPSYTSTGEISVRLFVNVTAAVSGETSLLRLTTAGSARIWDVRLQADGDLRTRAYDKDMNSLLDSTYAFGMNGLGFCHLDLELTESGGDIDWATKIIDYLNTDTIADPATVATDSGTVSSHTTGRAKSVTVGNNGGLTDVVVGHCAVASAITAYADTFAAMVAHNGEAPGDRISRLCAEEDLTYTPHTHGLTGDVTTMGDQLDKSILDLLAEAADSDAGRLYMSREVLGVAYRSRLSQYSQQPVLTLSCARNELAAPLADITDDQRTANDITLSRPHGSSYRIEQTSGTLSTLDPPDGAGRYPTSDSVSLEVDDQLPDQAAWRLHLGTTDEPRYAGLRVQLYSNEWTAAMRALALAVDVGDRVVVTDPASDLPPDDIDQLVIGYTETFDQFLHGIAYVTVPAEPWRVGISDDSRARADTGGSELTSDVTAAATSVGVTTTGAARWIDSATYGSEFPFDVVCGGERMTVTAVTGTTTSQTFTVTRAVNGITKAHSAGDAVSLFHKTYVGL